MGWNTVEPPTGRGCSPASATSASTSCTPTPPARGALGAGRAGDDGRARPALRRAVERGALMATQFHPEKSGDAGSALLRNWLDVL
jgi:glutamine amidotransferase